MATVSAETLTEIMNKAREERNTQEKLVKVWFRDSLPEVMKGVLDAARKGKEEYSHYIPRYITLNMLEEYFRNCKLTQIWLPANRYSTEDELRITIRWAKTEEPERKALVELAVHYFPKTNIVEEDNKSYNLTDLYGNSDNSYFK
jgi:hypothetical protein